jgi:hypothetical protein
MSWALIIWGYRIKLQGEIKNRIGGFNPDTGKHDLWRGKNPNKVLIILYCTTNSSPSLLSTNIG